jgi:hypothetical protein
MLKVAVLTCRARSWLSDLSHHVQKAGLDVLEYECGTIKPSLEYLCTNTALMAYKELFESMDKIGWQLPIPNGSECLKILQNLFRETKKGTAMYLWRPVILLARKRA